MTDLLGRYGVVSTGTSLAALTIDWADHSVFNHAFLLIDAAGGLVEATPHGVRLGHISEYAKHPIMLNTAEAVSADQLIAVTKVAFGYVGRHYNWDDIVRLGLAKVGVHTHWLDHLVANQTSVICSELVAEVGHTVGLDWSCGKQNLADVTPGLLADRDGMEPYTA
jgi:uncharacterized protein YycO